MKYDIKVIGNAIGGRQGWAYICNSGEYPVLKADLDMKQEYVDYLTYGKAAKVAWSYREHENYKECDLDCNEGKWELGSGGSYLSASFGVSDALELVDNARLPIVRTDGIVAIAQVSKRMASLALYKVGRVDIHCTTVATLKPLTDEEMNEVVKKANKWLDR